MDGAVGYFPTYTLGALAAAQLMAAIRRDLQDLDDQVRCGDFAAFLTWLREKVHRRALSATTDKIIADATGARSPPTPFALIFRPVIWVNGQSKTAFHNGTAKA